MRRIIRVSEAETIVAADPAKVEQFCQFVCFWHGEITYDAEMLDGDYQDHDDDDL